MIMHAFKRKKSFFLTALMIKFECVCVYIYNVEALKFRICSGFMRKC